MFELPEELNDLKNYPNWVCYKLFPDRLNEDGSQHYGKKPLNPKALNKANPFAKANDPKTWTTYEKALEAWQKNPKKADGIGFELGNTPYMAIDLDHMYNPETGEVDPQAVDVIDQIGSYTELSPSGKGFHIFAAGECPEGKKHKGGFEMYDTGRFITVTGNLFNSNPLITEANEATQTAIKAVHSRYWEPKQEKPANKEFFDWEDEFNVDPVYHKSGTDSRRNLSDDERIREIFDSKSGQKFDALMRGDLSSYNGDNSAAAMGLCNLLAWFCFGDPAQMDRIFRRSGVYDQMKTEYENGKEVKKWDKIHSGKQTYGQMTISEAIAKYNTREDNGSSEPSLSVAKSSDKQPEISGKPDQPQTEEQATKEDRNRRAMESLRTSERIQEFIDHIADSKRNSEIPTGYKELDLVLDGGLYPGLYTIGAIPSLGKTTFVLQMADYIAQAGTPVMVISLEMGRDELISKSVSRLTAQIAMEDTGDTKIAKTSRGILNGRRYEGYIDLYGKEHLPYSKPEIDLIQRAIDEYEAGAAKNLWIIEGNGNLDCTKVRNMVKLFAKMYDKPPVLVVDYVQIMKPMDPKVTDKQAIDQSVLQLKTISRDFNTPVVVVSSLNRENYSNEISFKAFKESGALEYGSDVIIGLQLKGTGERDFDATTEKAKDPREIELKILKNRAGRIPEYCLNFYYYPKFNLFEEAD